MTVELARRSSGGRASQVRSIPILRSQRLIIASVVFTAGTAMLASACTAPTNERVATLPATPSLTSDPMTLLVDPTDLPKGFVQTGDREVGALEVSDDPDELNSVIGRGRIGGWERTFVAEETRDDGVVFIQVWLSIYRDPAGAAWAYRENVADTWNESAGAIAAIQVPTLGDETVGFVPRSAR